VRLQGTCSHLSKLLHAPLYSQETHKLDLAKADQWLPKIIIRSGKKCVSDCEPGDFNPGARARWSLSAQPQESALAKSSPGGSSSTWNKWSPAAKKWTRASVCVCRELLDFAWAVRDLRAERVAMGHFCNVPPPHLLLGEQKRPSTSQRSLRRLDNLVTSAHSWPCDPAGRRQRVEEINSYTHIQAYIRSADRAAESH